MMSYKMKRGALMQQIRKITFIKTFKILKGELYNYLLMRIIELVRELFVLDFERGNEVWVPYELSLDQYPQSFHYYDPIMHIIRDNIREHKRELICQKNKLNLDRITKDSLFNKIQQACGIG